MGKGGFLDTFDLSRPLGQTGVSCPPELWFCPLYSGGILESPGAVDAADTHA